MFPYSPGLAVRFRCYVLQLRACVYVLQPALHSTHVVCARERKCPYCRCLVKVKIKRQGGFRAKLWLVFLPILGRVGGGGGRALGFGWFEGGGGKVHSSEYAVGACCLDAHARR